MFQFVSCCEIFKASFVVAMPSWAAVPVGSSCELLFVYNNVALIQYCKVMIGSSLVLNPQLQIVLW